MQLKARSADSHTPLDEHGRREAEALRQRPRLPRVDLALAAENLAHIRLRSEGLGKIGLAQLVLIQLAPLIQPGPEALELYQPHIRYLLIDEARYGESELAPMRNLAAALFRLENSRTSVQIGEVLAVLSEWLASEQDSLQRAFFTWARRAILPKLPEAPLDEIHDLVEMRTMVASLSDEWKAEARRLGLQEGELTLLLRMLRKRFGELPEWVRARLEQASMEQLEHWGEQLLQADSLEALFDGHEPAR